jgi:hypothetical protein|tara:strand:+ start:279 stop:467 length:189 start_codon:yes stop_codon:yes gene_type:complete
MKPSTRIALAAIIIWVAFLLGGEAADLHDFGSKDSRQLLIIGVVVCILLKFVLGVFVDKKKE